MIDDNSPILDQLPSDFKSAAIIAPSFYPNPCVGQNKRENEYEHIYPTDDGKPVRWQVIINKSELSNLRGIGCCFKNVYRCIK